MDSNLPATREETGLALDTAAQPQVDHNPQEQTVQQNVSVALLPLAIIAFLVVSFVAAAWTFLAALPAS
jgi:hypothetical protein